MTNNRPSRLSPSLCASLAILLGFAVLIALLAQRPDVPRHLIGMTYDDVREQLMRDGWSPRQDVNDGMPSGNGSLFLERGYEELVASSGTGLAPCRFEFTDADGRVLVVETEGEESGEAHARAVHAYIGQPAGE
jgi:hypothetical protein